MEFFENLFREGGKAVLVFFFNEVYWLISCNCFKELKRFCLLKVSVLQLEMKHTGEHAVMSYELLPPVKLDLLIYKG